MKKCAVIWCKNLVSKNKSKYCKVHGYYGQCQIKGCKKVASCNFSLCYHHYHNTPEITIKPSNYERFLKFIKIDKKSNCWNWIGALSNGYPHFWDGSSNCHAFRFAYETIHGLIKGKIKHKCNNRICCNPDHLYLEK